MAQSFIKPARGDSVLGPERHEGNGALPSAKSSFSRSRFLRDRASLRSAPFAAIFDTGRAFRVTRRKPCATPSAVLPAGEHSLAGRCPVSSRIVAANHNRRRRPLPAFTTPHERALEWKRRCKSSCSDSGGDKFFRHFAEAVGRNGEIAKREKWISPLSRGRHGLEKSRSITLQPRSRQRLQLSFSLKRSSSLLRPFSSAWRLPRLSRSLPWPSSPSPASCRFCPRAHRSA